MADQRVPIGSPWKIFVSVFWKKMAKYSVNVPTLQDQTIILTTWY